MVGPSASGSLKGMPSSTKSAPASATMWRASRLARLVGYPAVRYGINAVRCRRLSSRHRAAMGRSDKVVRGVDPVLGGVGHLDDRADEGPLRGLLREVHQRPPGDQ